MIHMLAAEFGVKPRLDLQPMQPGDVVAAWADIRRAQRKLGFDPTTSIEVGIRKFAGWFRAYRTGSNETASSGTDPIAPPGSSSGRRQT
jgi:nucleoside-diphosphate-sugar epimerase